MTSQGFLWHRGHVTMIDVPHGGSFVQPSGINNKTRSRATQTGAPSSVSGTSSPLLPHLFTMPDAMSAATAINERGQIAGSSMANPFGLNARAVLWTR